MKGKWVDLMIDPLTFEYLSKATEWPTGTPNSSKTAMPVKQESKDSWMESGYWFVVTIDDKFKVVKKSGSAEYCFLISFDKAQAGRTAYMLNACAGISTAVLSTIDNSVSCASVGSEVPSIQKELVRSLANGLRSLGESAIYDAICLMEKMAGDEQYKKGVEVGQKQAYAHIANVAPGESAAFKQGYQRALDDLVENLKHHYDYMSNKYTGHDNKHDTYYGTTGASFTKNFPKYILKVLQKLSASADKPAGLAKGVGSVFQVDI